MNIDEKIIELLKKGYTQKEISDELIKHNLKPNSLSSVEKHLKRIRKEYGAKTMFHLGYILYVLDFQK